MSNSIFTMILSYLAGTILLIILDKKISMLYKIKSMIKVNDQFIPVVFIISAMMAILVFGMIGRYLINLPNSFIYFFSGIILAFTQQVILVKA